MVLGKKIVPDARDYLSFYEQLLLVRNYYLFYNLLFFTHNLYKVSARCEIAYRYRAVYLCASSSAPLFYHSAGDVHNADSSSLRFVPVKVYMQCISRGNRVDIY